MTKQVEVITSVQRRRRWAAAEKERLVAASLEPGAVISAIAREAGIHPSQLYGWRRQLCAPRHPAGRFGRGGGGLQNTADQAATFAAVNVVGEPTTPAIAGSIATTSGTIEIEFATGARMRVTGLVDAATLSAAVVALARRERSR
jgi:transposase